MGMGTGPGNRGGHGLENGGLEGEGRSLHPSLRCCATLDKAPNLSGPCLFGDKIKRSGSPADALQGPKERKAPQQQLLLQIQSLGRVSPRTPHPGPASNPPRAGPADLQERVGADQVPGRLRQPHATPLHEQRHRPGGALHPCTPAPPPAAAGTRSRKKGRGAEAHGKCSPGAPSPLRTPGNVVPAAC